MVFHVFVVVVCVFSIIISNIITVPYPVIIELYIIIIFCDDNSHNGKLYI